MLLHLILSSYTLWYTVSVICFASQNDSVGNSTPTNAKNSKLLTPMVDVSTRSAKNRVRCKYPACYIDIHSVRRALRSYAAGPREGPKRCFRR
jgi:hypothetical protein